MLLQGVSSGTPASTWTRAAVHDTVASIVRQLPYRRDLQHTLLDRIGRWIGEILDRIFAGMRGLPHAREFAVIAAAVLIVLVVGRMIYAGRLRQHGRTPIAGGGVESRAVTDPWADAERLASIGQFTEAAHALYRAVVAALAAQGWVRPHASKTSGDYVRELRRRSAPMELPFRRFGARYDRIIYGMGICDAADYGGLLEEARPLLTYPDRERAA
jgi:hypothetical protein